MALSQKISFGTDGFRGVIGDNFNYENIRRIAQGFFDWFCYKGYRKEEAKVFVGYDRRFLSDKFAREFATVLINNDINCVLSKTPVTTPLVSYLTTKDYTFGIMITASHNGYLYNGVKLKYQGRSALPQMTAELEIYIEKNLKSYISKSLKKDIIEMDLRADYVKYLNDRFNIKNILSKIKGKIVLDLMYGSSAEIVDMLFGNYKNIIVIDKKHDPLFGEYGSPEPVEKRLFKLKEVVKKEKALCGFALDGDGDRFALIDSNGNYISPAQVAPVILNYLIEKKKMSGRIVQAVSLGFLTYRIAKEKNMMFEFSPVGFKYLADRIAGGDTIFGAEESGGYCWKGCIPDRDGFVTSLLFMEMMAECRTGVNELCKDIESRYGSSNFIREDFPLNKIVASKYAFAMKIKSKLPKTILNRPIRDVITIDGIRVILDNDWWFLIRPSGTEPLLRVYVETNSLKNSNELMKFAKEFLAV